MMLRAVAVPEPEMGLIQGQMPGSKNEWYFALALDKLKIPYIYQFQMGVLGARGSQRIDFVVMVAPTSQACFIQGAYWHNRKTETEDRLKHAEAEREFGAGNVHDFSEDETKDVDTAIRTIRKRLL